MDLATLPSPDELAPPPATPEKPMDLDSLPSPDQLEGDMEQAKLTPRWAKANPQETASAFIVKKAVEAEKRYHSMGPLERQSAEENGWQAYDPDKTHAELQKLLPDFDNKEALTKAIEDVRQQVRPQARLEAEVDLARQRIKDDLRVGKNPLATSTTARMLMSKLPWMRHVKGILDTRVGDPAAQRIADGTATDDDYTTVSRIIAEQEMAGKMNRTQRVAGTLADVGAFMAELGPIGKVATSIGTAAAKGLGMRAGAGALTNLAARAGGGLAGAGALAAMQPLAVAQGAIQRSSDKFLAAQTDAGLQVVTKDTPGLPDEMKKQLGGEVPLVALGKAYADETLQMAVMGSVGKAGGAISQLINSPGMSRTVAGPLIQAIVESKIAKLAGKIPGVGLAKGIASGSGFPGILDMRLGEAIAGMTGLRNDYGTVGDMFSDDPKRQQRARDQIIDEAIAFAGLHAATHGPGALGRMLLGKLPEREAKTMQALNLGDKTRVGDNTMEADKGGTREGFPGLTRAEGAEGRGGLSNLELEPGAGLSDRELGRPGGLSAMEMAPETMPRWEGGETVEGKPGQELERDAAKPWNTAPAGEIDALRQQLWGWGPHPDDASIAEHRTPADPGLHEAAPVLAARNALRDQPDATPAERDLGHAAEILGEAVARRVPLSPEQVQAVDDALMASRGNKRFAKEHDAVQQALDRFRSAGGEARPDLGGLLAMLQGGMGDPAAEGQDVSLMAMRPAGRATMAVRPVPEMQGRRLETMFKPPELSGAERKALKKQGFSDKAIEEILAKGKVQEAKGPEKIQPAPRPADYPEPQTPEQAKEGGIPPPIPPEPQPAEPAAGAPPAVEDLIAKHQSGRDALAEVAADRGLDTREQHILMERLAGRTQESIGGSSFFRKMGLKPVSKQRIKQIQDNIADKLGIDRKTFNDVLEEKKAARVAELIGHGKQVPKEELQGDVDARQARVTELDRIDKQMEELADEFIKRNERGPIPDDERRQFEERFARLDQQRQGEHQGAEDQPGRLAGERPRQPVESASLRRGGTESGVRQGAEAAQVHDPAARAELSPGEGRAAEIAPAAAERSEAAGRELTKTEKQWRRTGVARKAVNEARKEGFTAEELERLHDAALALHEEGNLGLDDYNGLLREARSQLKEFNPGVLRLKEQAGQTRGMDEVGNDLAGTHPQFFKHGESESTYGDQLFRMLKEGPREKLGQKEAYEAAKEMVRESRTTKAERAEAHDSGREIGRPPAEVQGDLAAAESEGSAAGAGRQGEAPGDVAHEELARAAGKPGDSFNFGANERPNAERAAEPGAKPGRAGDAIRRVIADFAREDSGAQPLAWNPIIMGHAALELGFERARAFLEEAGHQMREFAGQMFPRARRVNERVSNLMAEFAAWRAYTKEAVPALIDKVLGPDATEHFRKVVGCVLVESRLRYMRAAYLREAHLRGNEAYDARLKAAQATTPEEKAYWSAQAKGAAKAASDAIEAKNRVITMLGIDSPIQTEADFRKALQDPKIQQALRNYKDHVAPVLDAIYRQYKGISDGDPLPVFTQMPHMPVNLDPVRPNDPNAGEAIFGGGTKLRNVKLKADPFAKQAGGAAEFGYELDLGKLIENSLGRRVKTARQHALVREMVNEGLAVWGHAGERPVLKNGQDTKRVDFVKPPRGTQANAPEQDTLHVDARLFDEFEKAGNWNRRYGQWVPGIFTKSALASTVEFAYHAANLLTFPFRMRLREWPNIVTNAYKVMTGDMETKMRLMELGRIGALKERGEPGDGVLDKLFGKYNPFEFSRKALDVMDRAMRLAADGYFDSLIKKGMDVKATETARRNFINQLGNYNKESQHRFVQFLRDTGIGPFATAGSNYFMQGLRALTFNPGVETNSLKAQAQLRAEMFARIASVGAAAALTNFYMWGRWDGDDATPWFAVKVGDKDGKTQYIDPMAFTGIRRGMRETGLLALQEGLRRGSSRGAIADKAVENFFHSIAHPVMGPGAEFIRHAYTGTNVFGKKDADTAKPGESQHWKNFQAALWHVNPVVGTLKPTIQEGMEKYGGVQRSPEARKEETKPMQLLGPFGVKETKKRSYAEQRALEERRRQGLR